MHDTMKVAGFLSHLAEGPPRGTADCSPVCPQLPLRGVCLSPPCHSPQSILHPNRDRSADPAVPGWSLGTSGWSSWPLRAAPGLLWADLCVARGQGLGSGGQGPGHLTHVCFCRASTASWMSPAMPSSGCSRHSCTLSPFSSSPSPSRRSCESLLSLGPWWLGEGLGEEAEHQVIGWAGVSPSGSSKGHHSAVI